MNRKSYNIGIDMLKIISCIGVVMMHFGMSNYLAHCAVPVFMMISIYLGGAVFDGGGVINRIRRLMIPYFCWGMVYFIVKSILHKSFDFDVLAKQFLFGAPACPVMYFIGLLTLFTVLFSLISRVRFPDVVVGAMAFFCLAVQYAGWNVVLARCFPKEGAIFVGRAFELFPAAVVGYCFYKYAKRLSEGCWLYVVMLVIGAAGFFSPACGGYGYQGVGILSLSAAAFVMISFFGMTSAKSAKLPVIRFAASLTAGIYYMHLIVGWGLERMIGDMGRLATPIVLTATAFSVYVLTKIPYVRVLVK